MKLPPPGFCFGAVDGATVGVAFAAVTGDRKASPPVFDAVDGATVGGAVGGALSGSVVAGMAEGGKVAFGVGSEVDVETSEGCSVILKILELSVGSSVNGGAVIVGILLLVGEDVTTGDGLGTDDWFLANCVGSSVSSEAQVGDSVSVESYVVGTTLGESELRFVGWTVKIFVGAVVGIAVDSDSESESELPIFENLDVSSVMGSSLVYKRVT